MPRYAVHCIFASLLACGFAVAQPSTPEFPTTGEASSQFSAADTWIQEFMRDRKIPGGSLAIATDGEINLARGYGYADREAKTPVQPESLFRIASVSKPITAVAVLKLIDEGKLKLEDKIIDVLKLRPRSGIRQNSDSAELGILANLATDYDPWWNDVTLHHLLTHTGGWDRNRSGDPMFMNHQAAEVSATVLPVAHRHVIALQFSRGLDYAPGERFCYSNFGYCLLGRAIEQASGEPYEDYVRKQLFTPLGITTARIGGTLESERAEGEVRYYTIDDYRDDAVVGPQIGERVPGQYGGWDQRLLDAHGGWIMSSVDLVKFAASLDDVDGAPRCKLLKPETARAMFTAQVPYKANSEAKIAGYGYGWTITQLDDTPLIEHGGALPCTASILGRLGDRTWFAALFNLGRTSDGQWLQVGLDRELGRRIVDWLKAKQP